MLISKLLLLILLLEISSTVLSLFRSLRLRKPFCIKVNRMASSSAIVIPDTKIGSIRRSGDRISAVHPDEYETLLTVKTNRLKELLLDYTADQELEVFRSPLTSFRMRANFNIWRDKPRDDNPIGMYYAMFEKEDNRQIPCEIKSFPCGSVLMNSLMVKFMEALKDFPALCFTLFEVRFVTTQSDNAVITLCYKHPLKPDWQKEADSAALLLNVKIVGRSRKLKKVAGGDEIIEEIYTVNERALKYYQTEGAFSQPNAKVCEKMLEWALNVTKDSHDRDLLELYCGGGTFTAALAENFRRVLATEISKASVDLANKTFKANDVKNIKILRLSSEEFTEAYEEKRVFQRVTDAGVKFSDYDISTVLVDPPRAGLDPATCALLCRFDKIVYISCNPETLARDVGVMSATHRVERIAAFDQFPYTHHLEGGVLLIKKIVNSGEIVAKPIDLIDTINSSTAEEVIPEVGKLEDVKDVEEVESRKRKAEDEASA